MIFNHSDGIYRIAKITGPTHNLLCVKLSDDRLSEFKISALDSKEPINVTANEIRRQIIDGIEYIKQKYNLNIGISEVQFIPSDTYSSDIYKILLVEIIKRIYL